MLAAARVAQTSARAATDTFKLLLTSFASSRSRARCRAHNNTTCRLGEQPYRSAAAADDAGERREDEDGAEDHVLDVGVDIQQRQPVLDDGDERDPDHRA